MTDKKKSIRLNNHLRDFIIRKFIDNAFSLRREALKEASYALNERIYNDIYPEHIRARMEELPKGWLPKSNEFKVYFGTEGRGGMCRPSLKTERLFPYSAYSGGYSTPALKVYEENHQLYIEHEEHTSKCDSLKKESAKAEQMIRAIVYSCNNTRTLIAAWPECEDVVLSICDDTYESNKQHLPAIPTAELNTLLGLRPADTQENA